jgi:hypothetical protein
MKRIALILSMLTICICMSAQSKKLYFTEGHELNLVGKLMTDTPNPYHRVDTVKYKGFTAGENKQVRSAAGLAIAFNTNSSTITVKGEFGYINRNNNTMGVALRGYDLYIKKDGQWRYAASKANADGKEGENLTLISNMDNSMKECLLYLPMYSELRSLQIGVEEGSKIEAGKDPFRYRVGIFGSSYTQGISISRSGMSYPMQFTRHTGIQLLSLGCSGNCKMQPYFADVLCDAKVDALIFDAFSNPDAKMIEERLFPFIEKIQSAHPDIPLIFQQTIYRESRNFDQKNEEKERAKQEMAEKLMKEAVKKYKNVYFVQTNATDALHETSVDGIHPDNYGYTLWARSIEKQVLKILKKYGIK